MDRQHIRLSNIAARKWQPISGQRPVARLFGSYRQHLRRVRDDIDFRREDYITIGAAFAAQAAISGLLLFLSSD